MAIFSNDKELQENFETLQKENEKLESTLEGRETEIKDLTQKLTTAEEEVKELSGKLEQSKSDLKAANESIEGLKSDLKDSEEKQSDFDAKVDKAAQAKMAELGVKEPVGASDDDDDMLVTRSQFNKMTPAARSEFSKAGGKIKPE